MLLDKDSKKSNMVWEILEKIVLSAVMMSEGNQAAADHFVSASTEKIKKALAQVSNDPVPEQDAKVAPPPPTPEKDAKVAPPPPPPPPLEGISQNAVPNVPPPPPPDQPPINNRMCT